ncbi:MAG: cytochrome C [Deltaproteobacteria bacterium]|nr:cytochrome C [Candidatus Tharpella sp.]
MPSTKKSRFLQLCIIVMLFAVPVSGYSMDDDDCLGCHGDEDSVAANLFIDQVSYGITDHAELGCTGCHEGVSDEHPDDGLIPSLVGCVDCHEDIMEEYQAGTHSDNAECGDCHNPHKAFGFADVCCADMNDQCAGCHDAEDVYKAHNEWLPQTKLHLAMLPCISCHTDSECQMVVWYIVKNTNVARLADVEFVEYNELEKLAMGKNVQSLVDLDGDDFISLAEMKVFNKNPKYKSFRLQGRLSSECASHTLTTFDNRWDCCFCHCSGPESMKKSVVALPTEIGTFKRIEVEEGAVLSILNNSPDFYLIGATRSFLLNIIGLLIICGGLALPFGHGFLRFLTRKNRLGK